MIEEKGKALLEQRLSRIHPTYPTHIIGDDYGLRTSEEHSACAYF